MIGGLGWQELLIVLVIIMIIFGAGKLPQVAKSLGQGVKEFKSEAAGGIDAGGVTTATGAADGAQVASEQPAAARADQI
jgi:sec-independent protein translocase protein TatA